MSDPLDPNPFAKPIISETGNLTPEEVYAEVGYALDRWERCEIGFARVYSALVLPSINDGVVQRSFGAIVASATRQEVIWYANDAYLKDKDAKLHATVRHLLNLYKSAASRRNEIAHGVTDSEEHPDSAIERIWFLLPPIYSSRKREMGKPRYRLGAGDIRHLASCFEHLMWGAMQVASEIRYQRGPPVA